MTPPTETEPDTALETQRAGERRPFPSPDVDRPAPTVPDPVAPTFGELARQITAQYDVVGAKRAAEKAGLERRAASMTPKIQDAQTLIEGFRRELAQHPPPVAPALPPAPPRGLRAFLAPIEGETPESSIAKFISAIGLFAVGAGGVMRGDARASLSALTGAMQGWHDGDKERADRSVAEWKDKTDSLLSSWTTQRAGYDDWLKASNLSLDQVLQGV